MGAGINISHTEGNVSLQAGGDIVAGDKTVINNIIQRLAQELTTTPYKFLASYDIADRDIFYGRAAVVDELAGAAGRHKAIIINGASGAGKSSLVNAGLIPRLADNGYSYVRFREYSDPLERLTHLGELLAASPLPRTDISSDNGTTLPGQAADGAANSANGETGASKAPDLNDPGLLLQLIRAVHARPIVVVFDQFERFFVKVPLDKRSAFIRAFKYCLQNSSAQEITFIIALREEFFGQLTREFEAQIPVFLNEAFRLPLLPLTKAEAREAIVKPLENTKFNIQYYKPFVDGVLLDSLAAQGDEGAGVNPPHLQIVCNELFEAARQRLPQGSVTIDEDLYKELGGAQTILNTYLDKVVKEVALVALTEERVVKSVLQRMIDTTGTRRFVRLEVLERELPDLNEAEILTLIQNLLDRRVVEERSATHSLSHEYMVQQVKKWFDPIETNRKRAQETLERGLAEWKNSKAAAGGMGVTVSQLPVLLNRSQVEAVRKWVIIDLSSEEQELLQDSEADYVRREREEAERERQLIASKHARRTAIQIAFAVAVVLIVVAYWFADRAIKSQIAQSRFLASLSQQQTGAGNGTNGILLALEALPKRPSSYFPHRPLVREAEFAMFTAVQENREIKDFQGYSPGFSPDGRRIVTASADGTAQVWDVATGQSVAVLQDQHAGPVYSVQFSPDGRHIVTAYADGTARVWDVGSRSALVALKGHTRLIRWAEFSHDGTRIATASNDGTARVWDAASGHPLAVLQVLEGGSVGSVFSARFDPLDATRIVTASVDGTARVWDVASRRPLVALKAGSGYVRSAMFSPDGNRIVTASDDHMARVWDAASGRPLAVLQGHAELVRWAAFSPVDGSRIVTASDDGTTRVWDAASGRSLVVLRGHTGSVYWAEFSPDGTRVLSASDDSTTRLWDAAGGPGLVALQSGKEEIKSAAFSPNNTRVVTACYDATARVWDVASGRSLMVLQGHKGPINSAEFSRDGSHIVTASNDGSAGVWDAGTGRNLAMLQLKGDNGWVNAANFSPDGKRIVTASANGTARVWDVASRHPLAVLQGHRSRVVSAVFSPDGSRIATASDDKTARVWDTASGHNQTVLQHTSAVISVAFNQAGSRIVTASDDNRVRVWDVASGHSLTTLTLNGAVASAAFSLDGSRIITTSDDSIVQVWDAGSGASLLQGPAGSIGSVAFSPDRTRIVVINSDTEDTASVWRVFSDLQSLIDDATVPRQLTAEERRRFFLPPAVAQPATNPHSIRPGPPTVPMNGVVIRS